MSVTSSSTSESFFRRRHEFTRPAESVPSNPATDLPHPSSPRFLRIYGWRNRESGVHGHLCAGYTVLGVPRSLERNGFYRLLTALSYPIGYPYRFRETLIVALYARQSDLVPNPTTRGLQIGIRHPRLVHFFHFPFHFLVRNGCPIQDVRHDQEERGCPYAGLSSRAVVGTPPCSACRASKRSMARFKVSF
jgi:hypothetical protein